MRAEVSGAQVAVDGPESEDSRPWRTRRSRTTAPAADRNPSFRDGWEEDLPIQVVERDRDRERRGEGTSSVEAEDTTEEGNTAPRADGRRDGWEGKTHTPPGNLDGSIALVRCVSGEPWSGCLLYHET